MKKMWKIVSRRMCFNVFAHNRDDHSKNFTYLYNETEDRWHLSPAYDTLPTAILIMENIRPQLMEMEEIQEEKNFWRWE